MAAGPASGYVLPPLVHPHAYSASYSYPPPPSHHTPPPVPSMMDLERHYAELSEEKRRLEDLLMRTDRMMAGVRRGMDEFRMSHAHATRPPSAQPLQGHHRPPSPREQHHHPSSDTVQAVPLKRGDRSSSSQSQREREGQGRESVWPLNPPESAPRD